MADELSSSGRRDSEEQSADESANLIDTVTDPSLEWVGAEPRGTASIYSRDDRHPFIAIEEGQDQPDFQHNFEVMVPSTTARICSMYSDYSFAMYEIALKTWVCGCLSQTLRPGFLRIWSWPRPSYTLTLSPSSGRLS